MFAIIDGFTKYVRLYPLQRPTTRVSLNRFLLDYCEEFGKPKRILSDHGSQFTSSVWNDTLAENGIKAIKSSIRHPQGNLAEKVMYRLGQTFRTYCSTKHTTWIDWLSVIEKMTNIAVHSSTGYTPYELQTGKAPQYSVPKLLGIAPREPVDVKWQLRLARERMSKASLVRGKQQKNVRMETFQTDDAVLLRVPGISNAERKEMGKMFDIFQGPLFVEERIHDNTYRLRNADGSHKGTYNVKSLRRYHRATTDDANLSTTVQPNLRE